MCKFRPAFNFCFDNLLFDDNFHFEQLFQQTPLTKRFYLHVFVDGLDANGVSGQAVSEVLLELIHRHLRLLDLKLQLPLNQLHVFV